MVYRHLLNFWPLVPAVDIQAICEALKVSTNKDDKDFDSFLTIYDAPFNDFQKMHSSSHVSIPESNKKENMNVLIIGDGIGCLIKTIARMYRHKTLNLNIYVVSNFAESLARNLLLLSLITETSSSMSILEKSEVFLEIFGNIFLRASTSMFIETESDKILRDIFSSIQPVKSVPVVSFTSLKQKEIDEICKVFTYLKNKELFYDAGKAWENSLRAYFGTRYDGRKNLFDYHFNMRLSQYPIINLRKYLEWCETGTAFKLRKGRYDNPNKTLCLNSILTRAKSSELYYGDIATSPYITFGVECKNEKLFEKINNQHTYSSEDISKFNIIDFMTELNSSKNSETANNVNVHFLFFSTFCKSRKFQEFFDVVYITCDMTSWAENGSLSKVLNKNGVAVFETISNVVNSTKEQKIKHTDDIERLALKNGLKSNKTLKHFTDNLKIYVINENKAK